jgi:hypothetical protein
MERAEDKVQRRRLEEGLKKWSREPVERRRAHGDICGQQTPEAT